MYGGLKFASLSFINSDKFGNEYENDLLVGSVEGKIYHFDYVGSLYMR